MVFVSFGIFIFIGLFFLELCANALKLGLRVEVLGCVGLKLFFQLGIEFASVTSHSWNTTSLGLGLL